MRFVFWLRISPERYLDYYRGVVSVVHARCIDGTTVQFPASQLRRFIRPEGIHGLFELQCDAQHKFVGLRRLDEPT